MRKQQQQQPLLQSLCRCGCRHAAAAAIAAAGAVGVLPCATSCPPLCCLRGQAGVEGPGGGGLLLGTREEQLDVLARWVVGSCG